MFSRVLSSVFTLATLVLANPVTKTVTVPASTPIPASQCNTGSIQCCDSVESANSASAVALFGLLGIVVSDVEALVGITCTPITVIGAGGNSCSAQPVCCENDTFKGVVAIGCTPINLNL
ncbi:fungal hydrophobin [Pluteus cervinus]|uniref:Fungal hydrophobin n=1 Tax=Pluteus cervinus TaxID=181527 RepID=A0ACD3AJB9_9AGAR|nr:fungal hydrophobin [Pluteus cervinus]